MIFTEQAIEAIREGRKTQTRRTLGTNRRVGRAYAVQQGRGKRAVEHIQILAKHRERVGQISTADASAEGFDSRARFLEHWLTLHPDSDFTELVTAYAFRLIE